MGAYLSSPKTEKYSSDEFNDGLLCGSSSMQGWRQTQEDAHNSILDFDNGASFFGVYDGHGGKEVAVYTAQNFPQFLKNLESYKNGRYEDALREAFLQFDATLKEPHVLNILKDLSKSGNSNSTDSEDENIGNLKEEAQMPLEEVMAKYTGRRDATVNSNLHAIKRDGKKLIMPVSPFIRCKPSDPNLDKVTNCSENSPSSHSGFSHSSGSPKSNSNEAESEVSSSSSKIVSQRKSLSEKYSNGKSETASDSEKSNEEQVNGLSEGETAVSDSLGEKVNNKKEDLEDSAVQLPDSSADLDKTDNTLINGTDSHVNDSEKKIDEPISSSVENGEVAAKVEDSASDQEKGKGKGKALVKGPKKTVKKEPMSAEKIFEGFVKQEGTEDFSESDSDDATFHGPDSTSDDDEAEVGGEEEDDDEDDDDDSDDYDDEDEDDEDDEFTMSMTDDLKQYLRSGGTVKNYPDSSVDCTRGEHEENLNKRVDKQDEDGCCEDTEEFGKNFLINILKQKVPGFDSGCTAVVALVVNNKIYVANAGDSRCIVSRKGEVVEMSLDHKPEDKIEMERIKKAGGRVTCDGRVNGGLNLSRALGDHSYKSVEKLQPEEQMISPLPDIRVIDVDPDVEFMILACDGIWNFMSSVEVLEFVRMRLLKSPSKLSEVCEQLFDYCLAPDTQGDGTGCDNMTAVLVQFKHSNLSSSKKRHTEDLEAEDCKRKKTEDVTSTEPLDSSSVDSSAEEKNSEVPDTTE